MEWRCRKPPFGAENGQSLSVLQEGASAPGSSEVARAASGIVTEGGDPFLRGSVDALWRR